MARARTWRTPSNTVRGATALQNVKVSASPWGSSALGIDRSPAKIALTSLAKSSRPSCSQVKSGRTTHGVAREHEFALRGMPQSNGELPVETPKGLFSPLLPRVDDHLRVASGAEGVARGLQFLAQLHVVEDLAVERDPQRAVLVAERLLARREVNDGQAGVGEPPPGGRDRLRIHRGRGAEAIRPCRAIPQAGVAVPRHAAQEFQRCRTSCSSWTGSSSPRSIRCRERWPGSTGRDAPKRASHHAQSATDTSHVMASRTPSARTLPRAFEPPSTLEITREGERQPRVVPLTGTRVTLGRSCDAQLVLEDSSVSRVHAELSCDAFGRWWVRDRNSTNGTLVNGTLVRERVVRPGDSISIGVFTVRLVQDLSSAGSAHAQPFPSLSADDEPLVIQTISGAGPSRIRAEQLTALMAFSDQLLATEDPEARLEALCALLVHDDFPAVSAQAVRLRHGQPPLALSRVHSRSASTQAVAHYSHGVLRAAFETREPVLGSHVAPSGELHPGIGVRRLSISEPMRPLAVLASPIDLSHEWLDILYVEVPAAFGTIEWLTFVTLVAGAFRQAALLWDARQHVRAHAAMEHELQMAQQIQQALIPRAPRAHGLDVAIGFHPCKAVGGDYVDVVPMPDGRLLLAVADVCGKGLHAALVASSLHTMCTPPSTWAARWSNS